MDYSQLTDQQLLQIAQEKGLRKPDNIFNSNESEQTSQSNPFIDAAIGGTVGLGGAYLASKAISPTASAFGQAFRYLAGIPDESVVKLKQYGAKNVFSPRYEAKDFIGTTYTPEVQNIFKQESNTLKQDYANTLGMVPPKGKVDLSNTKQLLGGFLKDLELIDGQGNPIPKNLKSLSTSNAVYRKLYSVYKTISDEGQLSRIRVQELRNTLNTLFKDLPSDLITQDAKLSIYKDLENAGAKGMSNVAGKYKRVYNLDPYTEELTGENKLFNLLKRGTKEETAGLTERAIKQLSPAQGQQIMDELTKHKIAQQFSIGPNALYPTKSGTIHFVARPLMKGYYKKVDPIIQGLKKGGQNIGRTVGKMGKGIRGLFPSVMPFLTTLPSMALAVQDPQGYMAEIAGVSPEEVKIIRQAQAKKYENLSDIELDVLYKYGFII